MLHRKFYNLRRPSRVQKSGIVIQPPQKRVKTVTVEMFTDSDTAEYKRHTIPTANLPFKKVVPLRYAAIAGKDI